MNANRKGKAFNLLVPLFHGKLADAIWQEEVDLADEGVSLRMVQDVN